MLRTFHFEKLNIYPNSFSVFILQSHSRKKLSYHERGPPQKRYLHVSQIGLILAHVLQTWLTILYKAQSVLYYTHKTRSDSAICWDPAYNGQKNQQEGGISLPST